ncbi:MAG: hypothetical protein V7745_07605 [Pseudomonadales bacterium]
MKPEEMKQKLLGFFSTRKHHYRSTFDNPMGDEVLRDLAKFCRASETTFHEDARVSAVLDGRREVFLRITEHLNLTPEEFYERYGRNS